MDEMPNPASSGPAEVGPDTGGRWPSKPVGGHVALDFLNTTAAPRGTPIEWIGNGGDLLGWLVGAGILDSSEAERIAATAPLMVLDAVSEGAVELREWFRGVLTRAKAVGPNAIGNEDIEHLNGVLARGAAFQRVGFAGAEGRLRVVTDQRLREPGELLVPVAAAMADLLCESAFDLVRRCGNPACTAWFYDRTKGHRRRWCSQAVCGNRAKVAAHRRRQRLSHPREAGDASSTTSQLNAGEGGDR